MIEHLVGREQRHACFGGEIIEPRQAATVVAAIDQARGQPHAFGAAGFELGKNIQRLSIIEPMRQRQDQELAFRKLQQVGEGEMAFALLDPRDVVAALAPGQKLAQPAIGGAIARIDENVGRAVDEDDARTDQQLWLVQHLVIVELIPGAHHAGERVVIGNADHGNAELAGLMHIGARIRAAAQEREVRGDADLGISGRDHAKRPCTYQWGGAGLPSASNTSPS